MTRCLLTPTSWTISRTSGVSCTPEAPSRAEARRRLLGQHLDWLADYVREVDAHGGTPRFGAIARLADSAARPARQLEDAAARWTMKNVSNSGYHRPELLERLYPRRRRPIRRAGRS